MSNLLTKFKHAPVTVKEVKMNIFAPYEKAEKEALDSVIYEDDSVTVELKGFKLNQIHRDILDIATYYGDNKLEYMSEDNRASRLFSLYEVQKRLNYKACRNNKWLDSKFSEMQQSVIRITDKKEGNWIQFNIIEVAMFSKKQGKYALVLSEHYMKFFENEISIGYKPYLDQILNLSPQGRALARYIISFSNDFKIGLDKAMHKIGIKADGSSQNWRYNRNKILADRHKLKALNIVITKQTTDGRRKDDYQIEYKLLDEMNIYHPQKTLFD